MAIQDQTLSSAEHDWFATRSGATVSSLNDHKMSYFSQRGFGNNASLTKTIEQMEREWLASVPTVAPPDNIGLQDLWQRACANEGVVVGTSVNECKFNFYTTVSLVTIPNK